MVHVAFFCLLFASHFSIKYVDMHAVHNVEVKNSANMQHNYVAKHENSQKKSSDRTFLQICMSNPLATTKFQISRGENGIGISW